MAGTFSKGLINSDLSIQLLRAVLRKAPVESVVQQGFTYSQISHAIAFLRDFGLLVEGDREFSVSAEGLSLLERGKSDSKFIWMGTLDECRIAKIPLMDAYFPGRLSLREIADRTRI